MTLDEIEKRIKALEVELNMLRDEVLRLKGFDVIPGFGPIGTFKDDPSFEFVVRAGREYRDKVNRESLEEMDRLWEEAKKIESREKIST